jgi:hypothetical protein
MEGRASDTEGNSFLHSVLMSKANSTQETAVLSFVYIEGKLSYPLA